jgi:hypothetical protein
LGFLATNKQDVVRFPIKVSPVSLILGFWIMGFWVYA